MNDSIKDPMIYQGQFLFQAKYAVGRALNVGCNTDGAGFRQRGGINGPVIRSRSLPSKSAIRTLAPFSRADSSAI